MKFGAKVYIHHKEDAGSDPESQILADKMKKLGFDDVSDVSQAKTFSFVLEAADRDKAQATVDGLCEKILVNQVYQTAETTLADLPEVLDDSGGSDVLE